MIALYTLIGFSLLSSAFFTCVGILGIISGWFRLGIDLDWLLFDMDYWQERREARATARLARKEKRALKKDLKKEPEQCTTNLSNENNFQKFDIDLENPDLIIKSTDQSTGVDMSELIQIGENIEFNDLNAKLEALGI